ncbi:MAG: PAS domain-containing sensor histidine kinase [Flavobacteriales bacterium]|nr:PAS domain-containing sensor histidine kinase [Flavobacteriales bacterium]
MSELKLFFRINTDPRNAVIADVYHSEIDQLQSVLKTFGHPAIPGWIAVSSFAGYEKASEALQQGASYYISVQPGPEVLLPVYIQKLIAQSEEIWEKQEIEKKLRESERNYRTLTENSNDLIMRFDREFRHLYVNPITTHYLGIDYREFIGKTHKELGFKKEDYEYWEAQIDQVFKTGKPFKQPSAVFDEKIWFDWSLIPEFDENGEVVSVLSYSRDITEIIKTQKALKESEEKLRILNATKDRLFSIIAHDLRGHVGGAMSLAQYLHADLEQFNSHELKEMLGLLHGSLSATFELLEDLLIWARSQKNEIVFTPEVFLLHPLVDKQIELAADLALKKNVRLLNEVPEETRVLADRTMLATVLRNLLSNAIKFSFDKGRVWIKSRQYNGHLELQVQDEGQGMPPEMAERLFIPGEFVTTPGTHKEKGSGLGLIICHELVHRHGGNIEVVSQPGKGTTVTVYLPDEVRNTAPLPVAENPGTPVSN